MILYKSKTIVRRKKELQKILDHLIKLKEENDSNDGVNLHDGSYDTWKYASSDIIIIRDILSKDLTVKMDKFGNPFYLGRLVSDHTLSSVYKCLKKV